MSLLKIDLFKFLKLVSHLFFATVIIVVVISVIIVVVQ